MLSLYILLTYTWPRPTSKKQFIYLVVDEALQSILIKNAIGANLQIELSKSEGHKDKVVILETYWSRICWYCVWSWPYAVHAASDDFPANPMRYLSSKYTMGLGHSRILSWRSNPVGLSLIHYAPLRQLDHLHNLKCGIYLRYRFLLISRKPCLE